MATAATTGDRILKNGLNNSCFARQQTRESTEQNIQHREDRHGPVFFLYELINNPVFRFLHIRRSFYFRREHSISIKTTNTAMSSFEVKGGKRLKGTIVPQGAKNEALQIISAVLLTSETVTVSNIPDILDVNLLIELLQDMGVKVQRPSRDVCVFRADEVNVDYLASEDFRKKGGKLRGSVMVAGPMLARFKKAYIPKPGGDKIGRRRLDTHIIGFEKLGARFDYHDNQGYFQLSSPRLKGTYMLLDEPSVTGTANIIMAAVLAEGTTTIYNAACEPYVQQLCKMLNRMGARISGIGSNLLTIEGVTELGGTEHRMLPDMIEVGSFIGLAAMTQSELTIRGAGVEHLGVIPDKFRQLGIALDIKGDDIYIPAQEKYEISTFLDGSVLTIYDHPWPGFTPDLLSIVLVVATQAVGSVLIHQKMFESRLFFVDKLIDMGAQIILCDPHRATVIGLGRRYPLRGITMSSPDIRAGQALLIAALSAEGKSVIQNIEQIDRGYQYIDERLRNLGADIKRV
jgi:UDP-N-acetylglucosamine 1-carboxyvinyltransferase